METAASEGAGFETKVNVDSHSVQAIFFMRNCCLFKCYFCKAPDNGTTEKAHRSWNGSERLSLRLPSQSQLSEALEHAQCGWFPTHVQAEQWQIPQSGLFCFNKVLVYRSFMCLHSAFLTHSFKEKV